MNDKLDKIMETVTNLQKQIITNKNKANSSREAKGVNKSSKNTIAKHVRSSHAIRERFQM